MNVKKSTTGLENLYWGESGKKLNEEPGILFFIQYSDNLKAGPNISFVSILST